MTNDDPPRKLLRRRVVLERTGLSQSALYKMMADSEFPRSVKLGPNTVAWVEQEVQDFIQARIAERDRGAS
jgi:prophage regulatory protein